MGSGEHLRQVPKIVGPVQRGRCTPEAGFGANRPAMELQCGGLSAVDGTSNPIGFGRLQLPLFGPGTETSRNVSWARRMFGVGVPVLEAACATEGVTAKGPWSGRVTFLAHDPVHTGQCVLYCVGREGSVGWAALS